MVGMLIKINFTFKKLNFSRLFRGCNSCRCFCMELVKLLPVHQYGVDIFHILVLQEYWVLLESRIPLLAFVSLFISSHEQTQ